MGWVFRALLVLGVAGSLAYAAPADPLTIADVGLPSSAPPNQLFQRDNRTGLFSPVPQGTEIRDRLYVRWDEIFRQWVWTMGADRRMVLNGSKLHGARLGFLGQSGKNWFRLQGPSHNHWMFTSDREWPEVWVWDPTHGRIKSERYAEGWESIGGILDPLPKPPEPPKPPPPVEPPKPPPVEPPKPPPVEPPKPPPVVEPPPPPVAGIRCTITVAPDRIALGESVILTMDTEGPVTEATLDGASVDFPRVRRRKQPTAVGRVEVLGTVKGDTGGPATCRAAFDVVAP